MKPTFQIPAEQLRALLEQVISEAPPLGYEDPLTDDVVRWLSKAEALVEAAASLPDLVAFRTGRSGLNGYAHNRDSIMGPLLNAYFRAELHCPVSAQGQFIPPGETWKGYAAVVKVVEEAKNDLLIVDPYMDASLFTDVLPHCVATDGARCLTTKAGKYHAALTAAHAKWQSDRSQSLPRVEARYAPANSLHDRLIIVDRTEVWLITQSLKDLAVRSPASLTKTPAEVAPLKVRHYEELWTNSTPLQAL